MADRIAAAAPGWRARGVWDGIAAPGRLGKPDGTAGVVLQPVEGLALATIIGREDRRDEVGRALAMLAGGAEPPHRPRFVESDGVRLVWAGPLQWLVVGSRREALARTREALSPSLASVVDQSDARGILRVSGPAARQMLAKGVPLDLHPRAFGPGDAALTVVGGIGFHLWQTDDAPTYEIAIPRSMAQSFWSWLAASAAEFGCAVTTAG